MPDYKGLIEGLGFTRVQVRGDELVANCLFCGSRKFYFNTRERMAICFRGCFAGSAVSLITRIEGCDYEEAKARVDEGVNWFTKMSTTLRKTERTDPRRTPFVMPETRPINDEELQYLRDRNVGTGIAIKYGAVGSDDQVGMVAAFRDCDRKEAEELFTAFPQKFDYLQNRILWPVSLDGSVIGAEARSYRDAEPKVCYPQGVNLKQTLFVCDADDRIGQSQKWIIVVEGLLDALTIRGWGFPVAATFSAGISRAQASMLLENERLYSGYDPDHGGDLGLESIVTRLKDGMLLYEIQLPKGKDPNACSRSEFSSAFVKARLITSSHSVHVRLRKKTKERERMRNR